MGNTNHDNDINNEAWNDPFAEFREKPVEMPGKVLDAGGRPKVQETRVRMDISQRAQEGPARNPKKSFLSGLFGLLAAAGFISLFILGFGAEYLLNDDTLWLLPLAFGATFFFAGFSVLAASKQPLTLIFVAVGLAVGAISAAYGLGSPEAQAMILSKIMPMAGLSAFVVVGLCLMVIPGVNARKQAARHPVEVRARVTAKTEHVWQDNDHHTHRGWKLTWGYYAGGKERTWRSNTSRSPEPREVGDSGVLYLSETDPTDVWEKPGKAESMFLKIIGAAFLVMGLLAMALCLSVF